jgi:hypothetical protein
VDAAASATANTITHHACRVQKSTVRKTDDLSIPVLVAASIRATRTRRLRTRQRRRRHPITLVSNRDGSSFRHLGLAGGNFSCFRSAKVDSETTQATPPGSVAAYRLAEPTASAPFYDRSRQSRSPTASHPSSSPSGGNRTIEPQIRTLLQSRNTQDRQDSSESVSRCEFVIRGLESPAFGAGALPARSEPCAAAW